jgi:hypothetical protein
VAIHRLAAQRGEKNVKNKQRYADNSGDEQNDKQPGGAIEIVQTLLAIPCKPPVGNPQRQHKNCYKSQEQKEWRTKP